MQFAGNPNYVSGMFSTILNISKKNYQRSLAWGLARALSAPDQTETI